MKAGGGPRKGSQFEREVAKQLSLWWTNGKDENVFWRTQSSGARATILQKKGKKLKGQAGDLCAVDGVGKPFIRAFTVSLKAGYKNATMHDIMDALETAKEQQLAGWIREIYQQSIQAESVGWLLIVRRTRRKALVFLPGHIKMKLERRLLDKAKPRVEMVARIGVGKDKRVMSIFCTTLDVFLKTVDRTAIKTMLSKE